MPFDLIGFAEATPGTGTVGIAAALNETLYRTTGDDVLLNKEALLLLGVHYSALTTPAALQLRQPGQVHKEFVRSMLSSTTNPALGQTHLFGRPIQLQNDKLNAYSINATDEVTLVGLMLGSGKIPVASQESVKVDYTIRATIDQALTAHTWTFGNATYAQAIPKGKYAIVGMRGGAYKAANPYPTLARVLLPGDNSWRPGVPLQTMTGDKTILSVATEAPWEMWPLMPEIAFDTEIGYPNFELLSNAANTDFSIELALQKVG